MGHRRLAREHALQALFQIDLTGDGAPEVLRGFWEGRAVDPATREFTERLVEGVMRERKRVDERIREVAERWRLERMPVVDRNVLRVAVYELLEGDAPAAVVIDEAIEVAKRYGSEESGSFVHGLLDAVRARLARERSGAEA